MKGCQDVLGRALELISGPATAFVLAQARVVRQHSDRSLRRARGALKIHSGDYPLDDALPTDTDQIRRLFGRIDIYLFDQLLRGNVAPGMRILDAGCGGGRNLSFLMRAGYDVHAIDMNSEAVVQVRRMADEIGPELPSENFLVGDINDLPYNEAYFDVVLSSAVLHFSLDEAEFGAMVAEMWRVLSPGGLFWARLASSIGIEDRIEHLGERRFRLPDGTERFLVDEALLLHHTDSLGGTLFDPLKTTNVQGRRSMTTWVVRKDGAPPSRKGTHNA